MLFQCSKDVLRDEIRCDKELNQIFREIETARVNFKYPFNTSSKSYINAISFEMKCYDCPLPQTKKKNCYRI